MCQELQHSTEGEPGFIEFHRIQAHAALLRSFPVPLLEVHSENSRDIVQNLRCSGKPTWARFHTLEATESL